MPRRTVGRGKTSLSRPLLDATPEPQRTNPFLLLLERQESKVVAHFPSKEPAVTANP